jgi:hypothetical protein
MIQRTIIHRLCQLTAAVLLAVGSFAGTGYASLVDFEDLSLPANSYSNSGSFVSHGATFNNTHSTYSWAGWAYSSVNDTHTAGFGNQYAAYTGTGYGGSGTYGVGYVDIYGGTLPTITIPDGMQVQSAMFTNTTYAALSMLNGDGFAKKFTSTDWFKLTITGENAANSTVGSVDFYLAQDGSIVNTWQTADLSSLVGATKLEFNLSSSDNGDWGMNTPSYFAMDNMQMSAVPEPSTLILALVGGLAVLACRRRWAK